MIEIEAFGIALIPVLIGLVEVAKRVGLKNKYAPVFSIALGVIAGVVYAVPESLSGGILVGIALGLGASGLYSGAKNTLEDSE